MEELLCLDADVIAKAVQELGRDRDRWQDTAHKLYEEAISSEKKAAEREMELYRAEQILFNIRLASRKLIDHLSSHPVSDEAAALISQLEKEINLDV